MGRGPPDSDEEKPALLQQVAPVKDSDQMKKPNQVRIEVSGGVAELVHKPARIEVVIHDFDNAQMHVEDPEGCGGPYEPATYEAAPRVSKTGNRSNERRIKEAAALVRSYTDDKGADLTTAITDLLADLHHLCARKNLAILDIMDTARNHFLTEIKGAA